MKWIALLSSAFIFLSASVSAKDLPFSDTDDPRLSQKGLEPYFVSVLNGTSNDVCYLSGYSEIEVEVDIDALDGETEFAVFAATDSGAYQVANVELIAGYHRYPVEFYAGACTTQVSLTFQ